MIERKDIYFDNPYERDAESCDSCGTELTRTEDDLGQMIPWCDVCDGNATLDNDTVFSIHWYGISEYKGWDSGIVADTRDEMDRIVDYWINEDGLRLVQLPHDGMVSDVSAGFVPGDVILGNPAKQYWVLENGYTIGCLTEEV